MFLAWRDADQYFARVCGISLFLSPVQSCLVTRAIITNENMLTQDGIVLILPPSMLLLTWLDVHRLILNTVAKCAIQLSVTTIPDVRNQLAKSVWFKPLVTLVRLRLHTSAAAPHDRK